MSASKDFAPQCTFPKEKLQHWVSSFFHFSLWVFSCKNIIFSSSIFSLPLLYSYSPAVYISLQLIPTILSFLLWFPPPHPTLQRSLLAEKLLASSTLLLSYFLQRVLPCENILFIAVYLTLQYYLPSSVFFLWRFFFPEAYMSIVLFHFECYLLLFLQKFR